MISVSQNLINISNDETVGRLDMSYCNMDYKSMFFTKILIYDNFIFLYERKSFFFF